MLNPMSQHGLMIHEYIMLREYWSIRALKLILGGNPETAQCASYFALHYANKAVETVQNWKRYA